MDAKVQGCNNPLYPILKGRTKQRILKWVKGGTRAGPMTDIRTYWQTSIWQAFWNMEMLLVQGLHYTSEAGNILIGQWRGSEFKENATLDHGQMKVQRYCINGEGS